MKKLSLILLVGLLASPTFAHDTWVLPSKFRAAPGEEITFKITSGMAFPALDVGPKPDRIAKAGSRIAGETTELKDFTGGEKALEFKKAFSKEGVGMVWLQSFPKEIELRDDQVVHYLDEARPGDDVRQAWEKQKGKSKWKEDYVKFAKTAVAVGDAAASDASWREPVGLELEIVPTANPTTLKPGESATFALLRNGQPVPDAALALIQADKKERTYQRTDQQGRATFTVSEPGQYLLATTILTPPAEEGGKWMGHFGTFTFEVAGETAVKEPARKR